MTTAVAAKSLAMSFEGKTSGSLSALTRTTPVPNRIIDEVMPYLSDTELRVLMVVVRSTLGWQEGTGRKESDWLSHRQLQARTGRSSAVVSRAVDGLVKRGLIRVTNEVGRELRDSHERSRSRGRLFYRLTSDSEGVDIQGESQTVEDGLDSASKSKALPPSDTTEISFTALEISATASETLPRKVRTTKETGTKEIFIKETQTKESKVGGNLEKALFLDSLTSKTGVETTEFLPVDLEHQRIDGRSSILEESESEKRGDKAVSDYGDYGQEAEVVNFVRAFEQAYQKALPNETIPENSPEDLALLQRYLKRHGSEALQGWLTAFFKSSFGYVRRRHWSLRSFLDCYFVLQVGRHII